MTESGTGTIRRCYTVRFTRQSPHSAARVWRAITESSEISKWMGYPARFDLRRGGEWEMDFSATGGGPFGGTVVRVEVAKVLSYVFELTVMEWTLEDAPGGGCTYTFVQSGLPDRGEGEEGLVAGWHEFLDRLDDHLEGEHPASEERVRQWEALKPRYLNQLERELRG